MSPSRSWFAVWLLAGMAAASLAAAEPWRPLPGVAVRDDGRIVVGGIELGLQHHDGSWRASAVDKAVRVPGARAGDAWRQAGAWTTAGGGSGAYRAELTVADGWLAVHAGLGGAGEARSIALVATLDGFRYRDAVLHIDDAPLALTDQAPRPLVRPMAPARRLAVPLADGWLEVEGDLRLLVQDNRPWDTDTYVIRLGADAGGEVALRLRHRPLAAGEAPSFTPRPPERLAAGPRWLPLAEVAWEVGPGSALDLAALTPAPIAGRLLVEGDHFAQEGCPGVPVRLSGANLCFTANLPNPAWASRIAAGLRRMGHNAVRIHHHDGLLVKAGGDGTALDPEAVDRLDRLLAACIAEGLWITTDVYVSRTLPAGAIPGLGDGPIRQQEFKAMLPLEPALLDNWKRFATAWLTHRNPYTGRSLAEEPALVTIGLVNEDNLIAASERSPALRARYERAFAAWRAAHPELADAEASRGAWLAGLHRAAYAAMRAHLEGLGVRAAPTSLNYLSDLWTLGVRGDFPVIDNHAYHDHPRFPDQLWRLPFAYTQQSAVERLLRVPAGLASSRRLDRPFTVTELNFPAPNHHRAEYAAAAPAIAGFQGWSGVWRFAFSHNRERAELPAAIGGFDLLGDPIALLGERAMALLYRRGDVRPAPWAAALVYDPAAAVRRPNLHPHAAFTALALHARTGCLPADQVRAGGIPGLRALVTLPEAGAAPEAGLPTVTADAGLPAALAAAGLVNAADLPADLAQVRSPDGQLACGPGGRFTVASASARSVAAVLPGGAEATLNGVAIANPDSEPATVVVAALDEGDLATARRLLVLHLTDAQNTGAVFTDARHTRLEAWGGAPVLVRAGAATLALPGRPVRALHALDLAGARRESLPGAATLALAVARPWGPCLAWEIER